MKLLFVIVFSSLFSLPGWTRDLSSNPSNSSGPESQTFDLKQQVDLYKQRYNAKDVFSKITDNRGEGFEDLYGTRNLRVVLHGIYYRGGANNLYNREGKRDNMNPLPTTGIKNLCEEGFSEAIYLYPTNFSSAPKSTSCVNINREINQASYKQISGLVEGNEKTLLTRIHEHIKGVHKGPLYAHCWNGWHASGYVAAMALQQYCAWSPTRALEYWIKNTDGNSKGYESIQRRIKNFKPFADLKITAEEQALICP